MELKPGDVVTLKSGGHSLTVVEVNEDAVSCLWMGNEGDLFRETLPLAVLERADDEDEDEMKTKTARIRATTKKTTRPRKTSIGKRAHDGLSGDAARYAAAWPGSA